MELVPASRDDLLDSIWPLMFTLPKIYAYSTHRALPAALKTPERGEDILFSLLRPKSPVSIDNGLCFCFSEMHDNATHGFSLLFSPLRK
jgi:hypothetical protein